LDQSQHAKDYSRFDFIDRQKKLYSQPCVVHDEYFWLLADEENRRTIIDYCKKHDLSVEIVPVTLQEPGQVAGETNHFTLGYRFVHLTKQISALDLAARGNRGGSAPALGSQSTPAPKRRSLPQVSPSISKQQFHSLIDPEILIFVDC
jgi:hypothetical protein